MTDFLEEAERLESALRTIGMAPTQLVCTSVTKRHQNWRVETADQAHLLRIPHAGDVSLRTEQAALQRARVAELPVVTRFQRLDDTIGRPAALMDWLPGQSGVGVMDAHTELMPDLCRLMGSLRARLEQETVGVCATEPVDGRFRASRANWASAFLARVHGWQGQAARAGLSLGPAEQRALMRLHTSGSALAKVTTACLVHGDLRPANFLLSLSKSETKGDPATFELRGIVDWEFACMGDPLLAWALPLELPDDALAFVIDGYGTERVAAWLADDAAMERLDAYCLARVFQYQAEVVRHQVERDRHWEHGIQHATQMLAAQLEPGFARRKLTRVLELEELPASIAPMDWEVPHRALLWRAIHRLGHGPTLHGDPLHHWLAAVACALRHEATPDEGWARDGFLHLADIPQGLRRSAEPIPDRRAWLAGLERHVAQQGSELGLAVLFLGYTACAFLSDQQGPGRWMLHDDMLRGLQTTAALCGRTESTDPRAVLRDAALGLMAERGLAALLGREVDVTQQEARRSSIGDAWEDLTVFQSHQPMEATADASVWVIPVLLLGSEVFDSLPMTAGELLHAVIT